VWKSVPRLGGWTSGSLVALYVMLGIGAVIMIWGRLAKTSPYFSTPREVFQPQVTPLRRDSEFRVP
jgi:hypothetical protein